MTRRAAPELLTLCSPPAIAPPPAVLQRSKGRELAVLRRCRATRQEAAAGAVLGVPRPMPAPGTVLGRALPPASPPPPAACGQAEEPAAVRVLPNLPSPGRLLLGPGNPFSSSFLSVSLQHSARLAWGRAVLVGLHLEPGALGREPGLWGSRGREPDFGAGEGCGGSEQDGELQGCAAGRAGAF